MGWLIALAVIILLGFIPIGIRGIYDAKGGLVDLMIGPIPIRLYPSKETDEKEEKPEQPSGKKKKASPKKEEKKGGSLTEFLSLLKLLKDLLNDLRRKLRVKRLELKLVMAGEDPCDVAMNYGYAWAAAGNIMPLLDELFVIKKKDVDIACDFEAVSTTIYFRADATIFLGRVLGLAIRYGFRAIKLFTNTNDKRKGGAIK